MSLYEYKLSFLLVEEYFGPAVATICEQLKWGPRPLKLLSAGVNLPVSTVKQGLNILINFNFVGFKCPAPGAPCEYFLLADNILLLLKYPKFLLITRKKFGKEAECVIRELLYASKMTLYGLILKVTSRLAREHSKTVFSLTTVKNTVCDLIQNNFLVPVERVTDDIVPVPIKLTEIEKNANVDAVKLANLYQGTDTRFPQNELYWKVNFERFLIEYRNEILESAVSRRCGKPCGVVMRHLLKLSFAKIDPWRDVSVPMSMMQLRESVSGDNRDDMVALQHLMQYLEMMEEDSLSFIGRSPDYSGSILICFKDAFHKLAVECLKQIVNQKFGFKAARLFSVVLDKKYIELEHLPRIGMMADKEAKRIIYKLLEENFVQMHELRKATASLAASSGPTKSFILFYVDCNSVIKKSIGMSYKNIYNLMTRLKEEQSKNNHIFEKKRQADVVEKVLREQSATKEQVSDMVNSILSPPEMALLESLQKVVKRLRMAQSQVDEMIFLLQMYTQYHKTVHVETKSKRKR